MLFWVGAVAIDAAANRDGLRLWVWLGFRGFVVWVSFWIKSFALMLLSLPGMLQWRCQSHLMNDIDYAAADVSSGD